MSGPVRLDGRRARMIEAELLRRAEAVLNGDGRNPPVGTAAKALFGAAARIGEEVTRRLDLAPAKQADNFYTAAGIGRDPARPAALPVAFKLVDNADKVVSAPGGTQLMATAGGPVVFETLARIDLVPGKVAALRGLDADKDAIAMPSDAVIAAALPRAAALARRLRSGAAAGASHLQVDPAAGLEPGMLLSIGEGDAAREYRALAVEGDLVTIDPPLETGVAENMPVADVTSFAPFAVTTRDHQSHALYLGHASLLDVPSAVTITVSGTSLPAEAEWSWWGKLGEDDPPAWQALAGNGSSFTKLPGKLVKKKIRGHESLWLRAELPGKSVASAHGRDVRIAIGSGGVCRLPHESRCGGSDVMSVGFEAVASNAPAVTNRPFHPFGREPRLYDSFYIGSDEAFSKVGAEISLCFNLAGAELGPLVAIKESDATRLFAAGTDGLLYRAQLIPTMSGSIITQTSAELRPLPQPKDVKGAVFFQSQSPVAIWKNGMVKHVAVAAADWQSIYVARLTDGAPLSAATWLRLPFGATIAKEIAALAVHDGATAPVLYAQVDTSLYIWNNVADGALPLLHANPVRDLAQIEPGDPLDILSYPDAILFVEIVSATTLNLVRRGAGALGPVPAAATDLPETTLRAYIDPADPAKLFIAGYEKITSGPNFGKWQLQLADVDAPLNVISPKTSITVLAEPAPVAFSAGRLLPLGSPLFPKRPMLAVATANPIHVSWYDLGTSVSFPTISYDPTSIGVSSNRYRGFCCSADYTAVQQPGVGLYFRTSPGGAVVDDIRIPLTSGSAPAYLVDASNVPLGAPTYAYFSSAALGGTAKGSAMVSVGSPTGSGKHVLEMAIPPATLPIAAGDIIAFIPGANSGLTAAGTSSGVKLAGTGIGQELFATVLADFWHFLGPNTNADDWPDPASLAAPPKAYADLTRIGGQSGWDEVVVVPLPSVTIAGSAVWRAENGDLAAIGPLVLGGQAVVPYPHANIRNNEAQFLAAPKPWQVVGPDIAANPVLSWEYWNGETWWALATLGTGPDRLIDRTDNLLETGGVFFKVPGDIQPTEVVGRNSHWLRLRLVDGSYGEAKVTVKTDPITGDQSVNRDLSTIRAPYVIALKLGYCAQDAVAPEIILTEDSLGAIDQTSANKAGLEFPVFTPVGELMNPVNAAEEAARTAADAGRCEGPCPDPDGAAPGPCDAPGAYESCDSPCIAGADYRRPAEGPSRAFARGLMVGFDKRFAGDTVSLYVDAEPSGTPAELIAEVLHGGRFVPINVVTDTSYGLTEPGILTLAMPDPPDLSAMFGASAGWLRLWPKSNPSTWSPRLRGLHLNAALTLSVETRTLERLGASIGVEDQLFRLADGPVMAGSLELRVREPLAEEDKEGGALDVVRLPSGPPGDWVRWTPAEDLTEEEEPRRVFAFDADQGVIRFGNGRNGRIPPLGADVMAFRYARVVGDRANGVAAGSQVQLLAPLAGVDRVTALDHGAGGSDAEALDRARRRAAAKVRHGGRILTRADLEDYGLALSPGIAQVRAETRRGGMRLIVVTKEPEPRPLPAQLRRFTAQIREVAGFGLSHANGLILVGPRLLPLAIGLTLVPRAPDLFAEAAAQAAACLAAWFDPATGNHDGRGWPLGRLPQRQDIAAALAPIEPLALPVDVTLERADKETAAERKLPERIPSDVLVRIDPTAISFERAEEAA